MYTIHAWQMHKEPKSIARSVRTVDALAPSEVLIQIEGCGVCHTDLGFFYDDVRTSHALPLTLGHEIAGTVVAAGDAASSWMGRSVVVPAVIPCGTCDVCRDGMGTICRKQVFFGSDVHGGFASHVVAPSGGLCPVDRERVALAGLTLADLSVVADAVSTPFQAIDRAQVGPKDLAIFVGIGGVGGFGVQIARAKGAAVAAIDVDDEKLDRIRNFGAGLTLNTQSTDLRGMKSALLDFAKAEGARPLCWKIFETSGHPKGQELAFSLLNHGAILSVVGYTMEKVSLRLSNLMAFDATARGNWGCLPALYPAAVEMVLSKQIQLRPFIETHPMHEISDIFDRLHSGRLKKRPVLIPDFS